MDETTYLAAVRGRRTFRNAYRQQLNKSRALVGALETCITAINPPDRDGISLHEWNKRLKAATKQAIAVLAATAEPHEEEDVE